MALSGTVKVPGMGDVPKKYLAVAGAAVVGIVGFGYYRKRQAAAAIPITAAQTSAGDAFSDTTPIGPAGTNGVTNQFGDQVPPQIVQSTNPGILTNEDWLTEAQSLDIGADPSVVTAALVKILGGTPTTQTEQEIFHQVVGIIGAPPQGNPPLKLSSNPVTPPPPTTTPPPPTAQRMHMVWVTSKVAVGGQSIKTKQTNLARTAAAAGVWRPSGASLNAIIVQAAIRSKVGSVNSILPVGRTVTLYTAVPY